ncbi:patatin-like protein [Candidatus Poribacteria bacterium]|jgi:patatin-related protein|nr:patatin-like protein [Candidatus Poribacteria bacterium]MBT5532367.1 patatin-like protein [Candidatus Poribacteria bacterium]MBT5709869.1 patatin-like protein [Candidatus Poribacteria bacterium]MBT7096699.1 patatin-like protein [Candidatus Poribacteria bacterium]MBT7804547.1 patatin-like protein [Candidatus Poribacteria bacterium]
MANAGHKELRIALVCYGGVSLAVYMHGVTKELHKLVVASEALNGACQGGGDPPGDSMNPFSQAQTERAYWFALRDLMRSTGVRTRVVIDIIAGASAGGINGLFLGKALAHDLSQDPVRDLWMDRGDVWYLATGRIEKPGRVRVIVTAAGRVLGALWALRKRRTQAQADGPPQGVLDDERTLASMHLAFGAMQGSRGSAPAASLMPENHALDVWVSVTDLHGYPVVVSLYRPSQVWERRHRHSMRFRHRHGSVGKSDALDDFGPAHDAALAFAARSTSAFPGAFPPAHLDDYDDLVGSSRSSGTAASRGAVESRFFRQRQLSGAAFGNMWLVDGGVLDNRPFGPAIHSIQRRPAGREVDRRLVYIEPDPGVARGPRTTPEPRATPGWLHTVTQSLSGLPRHEPIAEDIAAVGQHNARVREANRLIAANWDDVKRRVRQVHGVGDDAQGPNAPEPAGDMHDYAMEVLGPAYGQYVAMKVAHTVRRLADVIASVCDYPEGSPHALFTREAMSAWATEHEIMGPESWGRRRPQVTGFLKSLDVDYAGRRIRFVLRGLDPRYVEVAAAEEPRGAGDHASDTRRDGATTLTRAHLDAAKDALHQLAERVDDASRPSGLPFALRDQMLGIFGVEAAPGPTLPPVDAFVRENRARLDGLVRALREHVDGVLADASSALHQGVHDAIDSHLATDPSVADDAFDAFLGFPVWDALTFPITHLTDIRELSEVRVTRLSPNDATWLEAGGVDEKLKGTGMHHFAAFMKRERRENDYLWGRLDGVEHVLDLVFDTAQPAQSKLSAEAHTYALAASRAVVAEERDHLDTVSPLLDWVDAALDAK